MSAEIAAVLRRAAELIAEPERWCQGALFKRERRCLVGALIDAGAGDRVGCGPAREAMERHLGELPEIWNDRAGRQHAEVLAALRAAAEAEERDHESKESRWTHEQAIKLLRAIRDLALLPYPWPDTIDLDPLIPFTLGQIGGLCTKAISEAKSPIECAPMCPRPGDDAR